MEKSMNIKFTKKELMRIEATAHRQALVDLGVYGRSIHQIHKNTKAYNRKLKHKSFED
jgi:hypothetical protein